MNTRHLFSKFSALPLLLLLFAACDSDNPDPQQDDIRHGVNFTRLFAEPTANEMQAIREDWAARNPVARDAVVVASQGVQAATFYVVAHTMTDAGTSDEFTHYGLVRIRDGLAVELPVLLAHHGGDGGVSVETAISLSQMFPDLFANTIQVFPAYRSESVRGETIGLGTHTAGGSESPWDYDVDDAIALLSAVQELFPAETGDDVASLGLSRGAGVALLQGIRDGRILGVTEYYGPTDFFGDDMKALADSLLAGSQAALLLPGAEYLLDEVLVPLQGEDGEYDPEADYEAARLEVLRRSPAHFTPDLPALQVHHHVEDPVVPVTQSILLNEAISAAPNEGPYDFNQYDNEFEGCIFGAHSLCAMPDESFVETREFLGEAYAGEGALVARR